MKISLLLLLFSLFSLQNKAAFFSSNIKTIGVKTNASLTSVDSMQAKQISQVSVQEKMNSTELKGSPFLIGSAICFIIAIILIVIPNQNLFLVYNYILALFFYLQV